MKTGKKQDKQAREPQQGPAPQPSGDGLKAARYVALAVLVIFTVRVLASMFSMELEYDESGNLTVPLNLFLNGNYMTWYYHEFIKFNPQITTGPTVMFPVYLLFAVSSSSSYVLARTVIYAYFLVLMWLFYREFYISRLDNKSVFFGAVFFLSIFAVEAPFPLFNIRVLGEVPAVTLMALSFYFMRGERPLSVYLAGLFMGLAILTKLIFAIALAPVLAVMLIDLWLSRDLKKAARRAAVFAAGALPPLAAWQLYKLAVLGYQGYLDNRMAAKAFFSSHTFKPGESMLSMAMGFFPGRVSQLIDLLHAGPVTGVILLALALFAAGMAAHGIYKKKGYDRFYLLVFLYGLTHLGWWVFLSRVDWYRHLYPGLVLLVMGIVLVFFDSSRRAAFSPRAGTVAAGVFCLLLLAGNHEFYTHLKPGEFSFKPSRMAALQKEFAQKVVKAASDGYVMFGYGWWQSAEISYLARYPFYNIYNVEEAYQLLQTHPGMVVIDLGRFKGTPGEQDRVASFIDFDLSVLSRPEVIENTPFVLVPVTKFPQLY